MQHKIVLNALADKYSTLYGEYTQVLQRADQIDADLKALHQSIQLFDPEYPVAELKPAVKRERLPGFAWGELGKLVSSLVRLIESPFTTQDVADMVIKKKANCTFNNKESTILTARVHAALKRLEENGVIRPKDKRGHRNAIIWKKVAS